MTASSSQAMLAIGRLEFSDVVRSRWLPMCGGLYLLLGSVFVLVGMRESNVLGFTGMGRVLLSFSHALVFILPLLGLLATGQVVNGARQDGTLELLFGHPLNRWTYFAAISIVRALTLVLPLVLLFLAIAVLGRVLWGYAVPWSYLFRAMAVSSSLLLCSVGLGLWVSTFVRNQAKALMLLLLIWATGVALVDFGLVGIMLSWRLPAESVFALAAINPVQTARLALLSAADPELATLGPVGFYLANKVGAGGLLALGIGWPLLVGGCAWLVALTRFRNGDLT